MYGLSDKNAPNISPFKKTYNIFGKNITLETGKLGLLINWSVSLSDESWNVLFVTAWIKEEAVNEKADFFPLVVDYVEKFYATWKVWWNRFQKREWKPSDSATLTSRLIDRPIRPMFPKWLVNDVQIIATVFSSDSKLDMGHRWISWASLALLLAWAPIESAVSWARISLQNDWTFIFEPTTDDEINSKLNIVVAGTIDAITMVEAWAKEVSEEDMLKTLSYAHDVIKKLCEAQEDFLEEYKKLFHIPEVKLFFNNPDETLYYKLKEFLTEEKLECLYDKWKKEFQSELNKLDEQSKTFLQETLELTEETDFSFVGTLVYKRVKEVMRKNILEKEKRLDSRKLNEVREIVWEASILPRTHGSALFQRWMTQALTITTLGWPDDVQIIDDMFEESTKRYIHHYNFPPYSVWEVRMLKWVWRREIGHGKLAERALEAVIPAESEFPYMVRVVSEITTCNWSSSMASVCGSTMSLMNAWVPIKSPVSWVAMWMIYDEETWNYKILSDIQAQEDFLWDMDFKVAMTKNWITAMQLDVKIKWLKMEVFEKAFKQAREANNHILSKMLEIVPKVSENLSPYAPLIMTVSVPIDKIRWLIGKWWENVQRMEKDYEVKISIADDWLTTITAKTQEWWNKVIDEIKESIWEPEEGYKWFGIVAKIIDWTWAIVDFKGKSWMIHISKLSDKRVLKVEDVVKVWDSVEFEILKIDKVKWRIEMKRVFIPEVKKEEVKI